MFSNFWPIGEKKGIVTIVCQSRNSIDLTLCGRSSFSKLDTIDNSSYAGLVTIKLSSTEKRRTFLLQFCQSFLIWFFFQTYFYFLWKGKRKIATSPLECFIYKCSRSQRRAAKVDKRMVLVHTHGLFIN